MTCDNEDSALSALADLLTDGSLDRLRSALEPLLNAPMLAERQEQIRAPPFERSSERNGYKDKSFRTRLGELSLRVPQARGSARRAVLSKESGQKPSL